MVISEIPLLLSRSLEEKNEVLDELLLLIYNLHTDCNFYEILNSSNRVIIFRHLLRLYSKTINDHQHDQIEALKRIANLVQSPKLLVELAYTLHKCKGEDSKTVEEGLDIIREKAVAGMYSDVLLMIHSYDN